MTLPLIVTKDHCDASEVAAAVGVLLNPGLVFVVVLVADTVIEFKLWLSLSCCCWATLLSDVCLRLASWFVELVDKVSLDGADEFVLFLLLLLLLLFNELLRRWFGLVQEALYSVLIYVNVL